MSNPFAFLSQVTVEAVAAPKKVAVRTSRVLQPESADLRVWNTGAIYPSDALIAEFGLEYTIKGAENSGNGIDIIDSAEMPSMKSPQRFLALSFTPRSEGKIDIFAMTRYNDDNTPIASVATQGSPIFGKETLLPLLKDIFGVEPNEEGFIDLNIVREYPVTSPNGIFRFPKVVSRGANKGEIDYIRRENQTLYGISVVEEMIDHTITEEDLNNNPELVEEGVAVGDEVQISATTDVTEVDVVVNAPAGVTATAVEELVSDASPFALDGEIEDVSLEIAEAEEEVVGTDDVADQFADVPFTAPTATDR